MGTSLLVPNPPPSSLKPPTTNYQQPTTNSSSLTMVCKTCEKKLSNKSSAPDPYRNRNAGGSLLGKGKGPATKPGAASAPKGASSTNKLLGAKHKYSVGNKCKICHSNVSQEQAKYCQGTFIISFVVLVSVNTDSWFVRSLCVQTRTMCHLW